MHVFNFQAGLRTYLFNSLRSRARPSFSVWRSPFRGLRPRTLPVPGKELIFLVLLAGLMVPYQALLTPLYLMFTKFGLANTHLGLAIVHTMLQLPFAST